MMHGNNIVEKCSEKNLIFLKKTIDKLSLL